MKFNLILYDWTKNSVTPTIPAPHLERSISLVSNTWHLAMNFNLILKQEKIGEPNSIHMDKGSIMSSNT